MLVPYWLPWPTCCWSLIGCKGPPVAGPLLAARAHLLLVHDWLPGPTCCWSLIGCRGPPATDPGEFCPVGHSPYTAPPSPSSRPRSETVVMVPSCETVATSRPRRRCASSPCASKSWSSVEKKMINPDPATVSATRGTLEVQALQQLHKNGELARKWCGAEVQQWGRARLLVGSARLPLR